MLNELKYYAERVCDRWQSWATFTAIFNLDSADVPHYISYTAFLLLITWILQILNAYKSDGTIDNCRVNL